MTQLIATIQDGNEQVELDLVEGASVEINLSAQDLRNYKARQGGYTQTFDVPFTGVNNEFFQMYFDVDNDSETFNAYRKTKAQILSSTIPQITGYLKLESVQWKARIYRVTVFSQVAELARELGSKKLEELDSEWLEGYDHNLTLTNIELSWNRDLVTANGNGSDIIYPFVNYGGGITFGDGSASDVTASGPAALNDYYFRPFMRLKAIFDEILNEAGFFYESTFLTSERFEEIYISLANTKQGTQALSFPYNFFVSNNRQINSITIPIGTPTPAQGSVLIDMELREPSVVTTSNGINTFDDGQILDDTTHEITIPKTGIWQFRVKQSARFSSSISFDWAARSVLYLNGNFESQQNGTGNQTSTPSGLDSFSYSHVYTLNLIAGDVLEFKLSFGYYNTGISDTFDLFFTGSPVIVGVQDGDSFVEILDQPQNISNDLVGLRRNFPDMKQIELIKGVSEMFNLLIEPDTEQPNKLYIEPYPEYLAGGANLDWTKKLDLSKEVVISPTHRFRSDSVKFEFADSEEYYSKWWLENRDKQINSYDFEPDDEFAEGEQVISVPFGTMPWTNAYNQNLNNIVSIDKSGRDDGGSVYIDFPAFLAYLPKSNGIMSALSVVDNTLIVVNDYDNYAIASPINLADTTDYEIPTLPMNGNGSTIPHYDLAFGYGENYSVGWIAPSTRTTYRDFWSQYMRDIYSRDARLMTAYFMLTDVDIHNLRLNSKIWVKDAYWRINKIQGYKVGAKESCKVELLKIVDNIGIYNNCDLQIDYFSTQGQVFFTDGETDELVGSQDCCEAFGFSWREEVSAGEITIDAGCYRRTQPIQDNPISSKPSNGSTDEFGACCVTEGETTTCTVTTRQLCRLIGGTFQGSGTNCIDDGC